MGKEYTFCFYRLDLHRPFSLEDLTALLVNLATIPYRGPIIFEVRSGSQETQYLIGVDKRHSGKIKNLFTNFPGASLESSDTRVNVDEAVQIHLTKPSLSLNTDLSESVIRSCLSAISTIGRDEHVCLQIILGPSILPREVGRDEPSPNNTWLDMILGTAKTASKSQLDSIKKRAVEFGFMTELRIGASGKYPSSSIKSLFSAIKTMSACGVTFASRPIKPDIVNSCTIPTLRLYKNRLSVKELSILMLLPVGEGEYPTTPGLHPKQIYPPSWYRSPSLTTATNTASTTKNIRAFATSLDNKLLSISPQDGLEHTYLLGATGSGKSTVMLKLALDDIDAGRSVVVVDPKADLVYDILARIPEERIDDVVVIDPSDARPVGFNPLETRKDANYTLIADSILNVFMQVFPDIGITAKDTLSAALLTLAEAGDNNLLCLAPLLTDPEFREEIVSKVKDYALQDFWRQYEQLTPAMRNRQIESTLNRFRQLTFRKGLRNIIGQSKPKFSLLDLFYKRKILLIPLNKGIIGAESAKLLGSLIVSQIWTLALKRAEIPKEKRHPVMLYVDELQDYLSLPTDFGDALAQARGLGVGIVCAHQMRSQLSPEMRAGVDANCRNKIFFGLSSTDAKEMEKFIPELTFEDLLSLPRYSIYTNFLVKRRATGFISGKTIMPRDPVRLPALIKAHSQEKYGIDEKEIEMQFTHKKHTTTKENNNRKETDFSGENNTSWRQFD